MGIFSRFFKRGPLRNDPASIELRRKIEAYGWGVMLVADNPPFGYTVGLSKNFDHPEVIISGFHHDDIHFLCNRFGREVKEGHRFVAGDVLEDWVPDRQLTLIDVEDVYKPYRMGIAVDEFGTTSFPALQAVWNCEGKYPWDGWPEDMRKRQHKFGNRPT